MARLTSLDPGISVFDSAKTKQNYGHHRRHGNIVEHIRCEINIPRTQSFINFHPNFKGFTLSFIKSLRFDFQTKLDERLKITDPFQVIHSYLF